MDVQVEATNCWGLKSCGDHPDQTWEMPVWKQAYKKQGRKLKNILEKREWKKRFCQNCHPPQAYIFVDSAHDKHKFQIKAY